MVVGLVLMLEPVEQFAPEGILWSILAQAFGFSPRSGRPYPPSAWPRYRRGRIWFPVSQQCGRSSIEIGIPFS